MVLLHGLAGSNRYFGGAFDALGGDARIVVPDLLGFGDSARPRGADYGPDAHAGAVVAALEELHVGGPVYLVAHSAGTIVALRIAALRPDLVRGVLAFGPPVYRSEEEARAHIRRLSPVVRTFAMDTFLAGLACHTMRAFPSLARRIAGRIRADLPPPIAADAFKHSWKSYSGTMRNLILVPQPPTELESLRIPIRWIAGTQDEVVDLDFLRELARTHDSIEIEVWPGGHDLPLTEARKSVIAVREMIAQGRRTPRSDPPAAAVIFAGVHRGDPE